MNVRGGKTRMLAAAMLVALVSSLIPFASPALATSSDVVISQVYGGGGNAGATWKNDFVELFNRGAAAVDITGWSVQYASSGGVTWQKTNLAGTIQPGQYFLVQEAAGTGGTTSLPAPDATGTIPMSASAGKVALVTNQTSLTCGATPASCASVAAIKDFVGFGAAATAYEGSPTPNLSNTTAALRKGFGAVETDNNNSDFAIGAPWPRNRATTNAPSGVGYPAAAFAGQSALLTVVVLGAIGPASTNLVVSVNLSAVGGAAAVAMVDDGTNGDAIAADRVYSVVAPVASTTTPGIISLPVSMSDAQGRTGSAAIALAVRPPLIHIHDVQGAAHISPMLGNLVSVRGVVIAKTSDSFWIEEQQANWDGDEATSEGILVYKPGVTAVVGDLVVVSGTASEHRPNAGGLTVTEIAAPGIAVTFDGKAALPPLVVVGIGGRVPPGQVIEDDATNVETDGLFDPAQDGIDFWESMEGMLVQMKGVTAVGLTNVQYGELPVVPDSAGIRTPRGGIVVRPGDFNPERVYLHGDVVGTAAIPVVKVGDTFGDLVGVIGYTYFNYTLEVTTVPVASGTLARETTDARQPYQLSVAAFNVENLSPTDPDAKYSTLASLIVNNLQAPDLISVEEIQDNSGSADNGIVAADVTYGKLIAAIAAAGGPTYQVRQIDPVNNQDGGAPGANIRVAFLFRTDKGLSFVDAGSGGSLDATAVSGAGADAHLTLSPGRVDPTNPAFTTSRKPLAGEFLYKGDRVFVIANHWNSKGGDEPLMGFHQPPYFVSEIQRLQQAQVVRGFVQILLAADPGANVVVMGDLNDFQFSAPVLALANGVLHDLINTLPENERYTYVFDGNSEVLDHILIGNSTFARPFAYDVVHVNSEFPDQASDHEPQVARLCVDATAPALTVNPSATELWPANHKYSNVSVSVEATDNADPSPAWQLVSVTSNEPDNGLGDGDTPNDIVTINNTTFQLRAERAGTGDGRVYTFTYRATDACGNIVTTTAEVTVPRDQSR